MSEPSGHFNYTHWESKMSKKRRKHMLTMNMLCWDLQPMWWLNCVIFALTAPGCVLRHVRFWMGIIKVPRWFGHKILILIHPRKVKTDPWNGFYAKVAMGHFFDAPCTIFLKSVLPRNPSVAPSPYLTNQEWKRYCGEMEMNHITLNINIFISWMFWRYKMVDS